MDQQRHEVAVEAVEDLLDQYLPVYEDFHAHPELSFDEHRTADRIAAHLRRLGLKVVPITETGLVGVLENGEGPVVAFRADIDGLPFREESGLPYASTATATLNGQTVPVMHGCGHDTHITSALIAAEALATHRGAWSGTVEFIFQPAEETAGGAIALVDAGLWTKVPKAAVVLGQHVWPGLAGDILLHPGSAMALADSLRVTVRGRQAHGSRPEASIDPVVLAASIVLRLQTIVSRELDPLSPAVVTVGTIHGGSKENIIPAEVVLELNIRTPDEDVRAQVLAAVTRIVEGEARTSGAPEPSIEEIYRFPRLYNEPEIATAVAAAIGGAIGTGHVVEPPFMMGSEDVGHLGDSAGIPTVFWMFGMYRPEQMERGDVAVNHTPRFVPGDVRLTLGTGARAAVAALLDRLD